MDLEDLHGRADEVIDEDDLRFLEGLHLQREERHLDGERHHEERVVPMDRPVGLPDEFRQDDQPQHEPAEKAGPGLLQPEEDEFR